MATPHCFLPTETKLSTWQDSVACACVHLVDRNHHFRGTDGTNLRLLFCFIYPKVVTVKSRAAAEHFNIKYIGGYWPCTPNELNLTPHNQQEALCLPKTRVLALELCVQALSLGRERCEPSPDLWALKCMHFPFLTTGIRLNYS